MPYWLIQANADGSIAYRIECETLPEAGPLQLVTDDPALGLEPDLHQVRAAIEDGQVTAITSATQAPAVYLHLGIGGGDGDDPPGIVNDGQQALLVDVALRAGPDLGSPVLPVSGDWRVTIRDDTGAIYDVVRLTITAGQAQVSYTSNQRPAVCQILERDFIPVQAGGVTYQVRLVGRPVFKVYRVL